MRNVERFGWNPVIVDVLRVDSCECAGPDVEHDFVHLDALFSKAVEQGLGEVQSCRRGGNAAGLTSVDRLVSLSVERLVGAVDVWGKGKMTEFRKQVQNLHAPLEPHRPAPVRMDRDHATAFLFIKLDDGVHLKLPTGTDESAELLGVGGLGKEIENLGLATSACAAEQPGGHNPASIDDEEISLSQKIGKVEEALVPEDAGVSLEGQKPRCVAFRERLLSDPVRR